MLCVLVDAVEKCMRNGTLPFVHTDSVVGPLTILLSITAQPPLKHELPNCGLVQLFVNDVHYKIWIPQPMKHWDT